MVKYYQSGWWLDGDTIYHTEEECAGARRVRAIQPEERTLQPGLEECETCRRISTARMAGRRHYNQ